MKAENSFEASVGICVTTWRHTFPCCASNKIVQYGIVWRCKLFGSYSRTRDYL